MSAYVVSKQSIDLLVRTALDLGGRDCLNWWRVDENGDYVGWRELNPQAEGMIDTDYRAYCTPSAAGQILVSENVKSVHDRYPGDDPDLGELPGPVDAYYMGPYVYADPGRALPPAELFASIDCLDYQSCEHDGWRRSEAFAFLEALRNRACRFIPASARWTLEESGVSW